MTGLPQKQICCPSCSGQSFWSHENPWRPFCTERCKQRDLGAWASDSYRIPANTTSHHLEDTQS
ncbi:DNA gyrase inhibitor YacG [Chitinimonas sp. PSY-7]|uniref:DNA gyrase inhibitor YacG n=1 Tax=Chitinimonas sp. PSY-7 TaxID=3459088 RepID=UPI00403FEA3B